MSAATVTIISNLIVSVMILFLTRAVTKHDRHAAERNKITASEIMFLSRTGNLAYKTARIVQDDRKCLTLAGAIKLYKDAETEREKLMSEAFMKGG